MISERRHCINVCFFLDYKPNDFLSFKNIGKNINYTQINILYLINFIITNDVKFIYIYINIQQPNVE